MATATYLSTVSRKHRLQVDFPLNHIYRVPMENVTVNLDGSYMIDGAQLTMDKDTRFAWLIGRYENGVKAEWPEFVERDANRNGEIISSVKRPSAEEGWEAYDLVVQWTINAVVRIFVDIETAKYPEDASEDFQAAADEAAAAWIAARPLIAI